MDPISNTDRLVILLRQKLEERAKSTGRAPRVRPGADIEEPPKPAHVRALASIDWTDERAMRRTILQTLLADQLGHELLNDAQFQQVVSRVSAIIEEDADAAALLTRVIADLRRGP